MKWAIFVFTLVLLQLSDVLGAASYDPIKINEDDGNTKYCEYNGVKFLPRSVFKLYDSCMKCTCSGGDSPGLYCATLSTAFTVHVPDDSVCISVIVGCRNRWVFRNNPYKRCPKRLRPTNISMVGK